MLESECVNYESLKSVFRISETIPGILSPRYMYSTIQCLLQENKHSP